MFASVRLSNSSPDGQRVCWLVSTGGGGGMCQKIRVIYFNDYIEKNVVK